MRLGRKDLYALVGVFVLAGMFVLLTLKGAMTEGIFIAMLGALIGILGIHTAGNVASKKYKPDEKDLGDN